MPRPFTPAEREHVRHRLIEAAGEHFARFGLRRASIAEIARAAGVGKGTVYLFFPSRALLFAAAAARVEETVRQTLLGELRRPGPHPRERLEALVRSLFRVLEEQPLLRVLLDPAEMEVLLRELPHGAIEENLRGDDAFFRGVERELEDAGEMRPVEPGTLGALAKAVFAISLQGGMIGAEGMAQVTQLLARGVACALAPAAEDA